MKLIFVYGTLKSGQYNCRRFLEGAKLIGEAKTSAWYTLHNLGPYPALSEVGKNQIPGEIWQVNNETFYALDQMEKGAGYYRTTCMISGIVEYDKPIWCWCIPREVTKNHVQIPSWPPPVKDQSRNRESRAQRQENHPASCSSAP